MFLREVIDMENGLEINVTDIPQKPRMKFEYPVLDFFKFLIFAVDTFVITNAFTRDEVIRIYNLKPSEVDQKMYEVRESFESSPSTELMSKIYQDPALMSFLEKEENQHLLSNIFEVNAVWQYK